jgi:hypothetical protein
VRHRGGKVEKRDGAEEGERQKKRAEDARCSGNTETDRRRDRHRYLHKYK